MTSSSPSFARLSRSDRIALLSCYSEDISASKAARIVGVNRKTVNQWYSAFRTALIASLGGHPTEIEVQENYFTKFIAHRKGLYYGVSRMNEKDFVSESFARYKKGTSFRKYLDSLDMVRELLEL